MAADLKFGNLLKDFASVFVPGGDKVVDLAEQGINNVVDSAAGLVDTFTGGDEAQPAAGAQWWGSDCQGYGFCKIQWPRTSENEIVKKWSSTGISWLEWVPNDDGYTGQWISWLRDANDKFFDPLVDSRTVIVYQNQQHPEEYREMRVGDTEFSFSDEPFNMSIEPRYTPLPSSPAGIVYSSIIDSSLRWFTWISTPQISSTGFGGTFAEYEKTGVGDELRRVSAGADVHYIRRNGNEIQVSVDEGNWNSQWQSFSEDPLNHDASVTVCIGHVTKIMANKVYVMQQPIESSVVTFTEATYDENGISGPTWKRQGGKLVSATGLILTYDIAQDTFTLEKKSDSPWQFRWQMDDGGDGNGILHTTYQNGIRQYLQVRTEWVTLSSDRKLACLKDMEKAGSMDTAVYADKTCPVSNSVTPEPTVKQPDSLFKQLTPDFFRRFQGDSVQTWGFFGPFTMNTDREEIGTLVFSSDLITSLQSDIDNGIQYHYQNHMGNRDSLLIRVTDLLNDKYLAVPVVENASYRSDSACFDYEVNLLSVEFLSSRNIWDYKIVGTIRDPQDPSTKMSTMLDCSLKGDVYTVMKTLLTQETWKKCNNPQYRFVYGQWGDCSQSCGNGFQNRDATCYLQDSSDVSLNVPVDDRFCTQTKEATTQPCNTQPCLSYTYKYGEWTECSEPCGPGTQTRSVWCKDSNGNIVDNSLCSEGMPSITQACNKGPCMYRTGPWSTCSADCGVGKQTRTVQCVDPNGSPVENFLCTSQIPTATQDCNTGPCAVYQYKEGAWSECVPNEGHCGPGTQTREVKCIDQEENIATGCQGDRPEDSQGCNILCEDSCKSDAITDKRLWYIWTTKDGQKRYLSVDDDSLALTDKRPRHGWIVSRHDKHVADAVRIQLHTDVATKHSLHFEKKSLKASTKVHAIYIHELTHHNTQGMQYQFSAHGNGCKTPEEYTFDSIASPIWTFERSGRGTDKRFHPISILIPLNWDEWVFWLALAGIIIAVVWTLFVLLSIASYAWMGSTTTQGEQQTSKYEDMTKLKEDIDAKVKQIMNNFSK